MPNLIQIVGFVTPLICGTFIAIYFHFIINYGKKFDDIKNRIDIISIDNDKRQEEIIGYLQNIQSLIEDSPERQKELDDLLADMQELANSQNK